MGHPDPDPDPGISLWDRETSAVGQAADGLAQPPGPRATARGSSISGISPERGSGSPRIMLPEKAPWSPEVSPR